MLLGTCTDIRVVVCILSVAKSFLRFSVSLSHQQQAQVQPRGWCQCSPGLWCEPRAPTWPSGVTWPATEREWSRTLSGRCTWIRLLIERSASLAQPSPTTPTPSIRSVSTPKRSTSRDWAETPPFCTSPSCRPRTRAFLSATHQTQTASTWAPTALEPTLLVSLSLGVFRKVSRHSGADRTTGLRVSEWDMLSAA